jgi:hypothetical protein
VLSPYQLLVEWERERMMEMFSGITVQIFFGALGAIGALLSGYGTIKIVKSANKYNKNKSYEYKMKLAQDAIYAFNHLKSDLNWVRNPFSYEDETIKLNNLEESNDFIKKMKKAGAIGGITLLRLDSRSESMVKINQLESLFKAVFDNIEPFKNMREVHSEIRYSAQGLCRHFDNKYLEKDLLQKWEKVIWSEDGDELTKKIDKAVEDIENICQPILKGEAR